jgi:hypothetical protein
MAVSRLIAAAPPGDLGGHLQSPEPRLSAVIDSPFHVFVGEETLKSCGPVAAVSINRMSVEMLR